MNHGVKKVKFNKGQDANQALIRKLLFSFFTHGTVKTTHAKARLLKSTVDKVVDLSKREGVGGYNKMLSYLGNQNLANTVKDVIAPQLLNKVGGYVRLIKHIQRLSDGAYVTQVEWAQPVSLEVITKKSKDESKSTQ